MKKYCLLMGWSSLFTVGFFTLFTVTAMAECVPVGNGQTYCGRYPPPAASTQAKRTPKFQKTIVTTTGSDARKLTLTVGSKKTTREIRTPKKHTATLIRTLKKPTRGPIFGLPEGVSLPDLVVSPHFVGFSDGSPMTGYCGPWNGGNQSVMFSVRNIGTDDSPPSVVSIGIQNQGLMHIPVQSLFPGQQINKSVLISAEAWAASPFVHPSVYFGILADANLDVEELSEGNNFAQNLYCQGPAT